MNAFTAITPAAPDLATAWFRDVIAAERDALSAFLHGSLDSVPEAVALLARQERPIILIGVGKSGHVAAKLAATFSSLGTPALFVNAGEAAHGDLGAITPGSAVLLLSNSGATEEIVRILPLLKARGCTLIGIIGRADSPLARAVDHLILAEVEREADHIGMAPTASTTLHLTIGDALAVAVSRSRGFTRADFLRHHPAGLLGRQMIPVASIMHQGDDLPRVEPATPLVDVLTIMSRKRLGAACVVDGEDRLLGLIVDGDVRRYLQAHGADNASAAAMMRRDPQVVAAGATIGDVLLMRNAKGGAWLVLPVVDDAGHLLGMLHTNDLIQG
ncbi:KpsF/GutQ family sugar-phosphate isomerase [Stakelama pacifica]|uniref:Arabinose-5-phosphate isomerase n=1 Tax=Stakelama pacifica TaxID=517720 RepID=A0A4V3BSI8_9SPHN|nr:KpsF/GutQ family sugar-phosphate isomerase [Stakelama pacifica]TDN79538.1 arabinose-5-phosphate isomerase [Stakelama pacifica]GGP00236.1 arabinose 5-phosphate isomerase [Stakelama pacifica]